MATWEHSGFSAWAGQPIEPSDTEHRLFLSRYFEKAVISNQRLSVDDSNPLATTVTYRSGKTEQIFPMDFKLAVLCRTLSTTPFLKFTDRMLHYHRRTTPGELRRTTRGELRRTILRRLAKFK